MKKNLLFLITFLIIIQCNKAKKNNLEAMNNFAMPSYEELTCFNASKDSLKVLIIGNSITTHGIASDIGWLHKSGMASSEISKDYVHLLFNNIKKNNPNKNIIFRYSNWSQLERSPNTFKGFKIALKFKPDILIYQLSDNINMETVDAFKEKSIDFLQKFQNRKYVVSPFFMNQFNYNASKKIATESNASLIDISNISKSIINRASSEFRADKSQWKSEGIGEHPGNTGMINISNAVFNAIIQ